MLCSVAASVNAAEAAPEPDAPHFETVVVAPKEVDGSNLQLTRVDGAVFGALPSRTAEDALRLVPGLVLVQHGSEGKAQQLFLRGFDASHGADFAVSVEGVPWNEWSNVHAQGYLDLASVIPETVRAVEVRKGPFALEQGAFAVAGSADYQLGIDAGSLGVRSAYTVSTLNRHRLVTSYSPRGGCGHDFIAVEAMHDAGFGENRASERVALVGRLRLLDTARAGRVSLTTLGHYSRFALPGIVPASAERRGGAGVYDTLFPPGAGESGRATALLSYALERGAHAVTATLHGSARTLTLRENFTGFLLDPVAGDARLQQQAGASVGVFARYRGALARTLALQAELSWLLDGLGQREDQLDRAGSVRGVRRALSVLQSRLGAAAGLVWRPLPSLSLEAGGRVDLLQLSVGEAGGRGAGLLPVVSPRLALNWTAAPALSLRLAYGRGFRPPEARAFSTFIPQATGLDEETQAARGSPATTASDAVELAARFAPSRLLQLTATSFATWVARESVFDHVSGLNLELNATRRVGAELVLASAPRDWLQLEASTAVVDARFSDSGRPIPFAPWLTAAARAIVSHPSGLRAALRVLVLAPRDLPLGARGTLQPFVDATVGYDRGRWRVALAAENLIPLGQREGEYYFASDWQRGSARSELPTLHVAPSPPFNLRLTLAAVF